MTIHPVDRADLRDRVQRALAEFLAARHRQLMEIDPALAPMAETAESFVLGGGKRLRPAFAYWGYRGAGGADGEEVVRAAAAMEFFQASALIHDDLMDRSATRRGEPSVHCRFAELHRRSGWHGDPEGYGSSAAILLGDMCLVWSDELLHASGLDPVTLARARVIFDAMRTEVTAGQYLDVLVQATGDVSTAKASTIARFKSAKYTVERPLLLGAAIADAPAATHAAYSAFGLPLGEAFQLRDDILGVFGDPAATGKPAGDDLREGKRTYLIAIAFESAAPAEADRLRAGLGDPDLSTEGVHDLREIIVRTGALDATEKRISNLTGEALAALGRAPIDPTAAGVLTELADAATHRST
ncbi:geranylgeranyl diphosphate synthase type I [Allocatelliglobosispora scoriae]|uniref:Geranylgeranyl diphosphate synthase type I n=1 Tax=Allocatelliglobosispora scoriae TaxID=643052 RepID=A0A841BMB4_9ACTN|nr:polyprenyl synthetase family protein [Allocatelliglobosispora scoriae]MBB5869414.1 geranylgeranyl diphosphate synthase type I [Allocatelliglobosispora scoriae]